MTIARIATICQARQYYNNVGANRDHVMGLLDLALQAKPDLVCLPETFTTVNVPFGNPYELAETIPGPTTEAVAQRARQHHCYIICPMRNQREGKLYNSAIIIDRQGQIAGIYDKAHPVTTTIDYTSFENDVTPGDPDVPVFDLDFGRIGIQICYDAGFPESWQVLADKGARLVFWPSAYNGGYPLEAYAYLHHYYVVSSVRTDMSRIIDPLGQVVKHTDERQRIIYQDINCDFCVSHYDWCVSIPDLLLAEYGDRVKVVSHRDSGHFLVEPLDDAITIAQLQREFGFESTYDYHQRHREAHARLRAGLAPEPELGPHGDRPMHGTFGKR